MSVVMTTLEKEIANIPKVTDSLISYYLYPLEHTPVRIYHIHDVRVVNRIRLTQGCIYLYTARVEDGT
jgi:hypothetical protein